MAPRRRLDPALAGFFPAMPEDLGAIVEDVGRIEDRDVEAARRVLARTGKLLGPHEVRAAAGSIGVDALTEGLFDHEPSRLDDTAIAAMLDAVRDVALSESQTHRALSLLADALDQPYLTDLIYYPREELETARLIEVARTHHGKALEPFLDPQCHPVPERERSQPPSALVARARAVLLAMWEADELELSMGERAAASLAEVLARAPSGEPETLSRWLTSKDNGIAEVFADDTQIARRWAELTTR